MSEHYDINEFYTHATDQKGHCRSFRAAFPTTVASDLEALVASRKFPEYRTVADVIRDGVFHRLSWLDEQQDAELSSTLSLWWALQAAEKLVSWYKDGDRLVENLSEMAYRARRNSEDSQLVKYEIYSALETSMPNACREKLNDLLEKFYG